jgi:hypothetical protein
MPVDDAQLWAQNRRRVRPDDPAQIVLIGTSRMHMGLQPRMLAIETHRSVVQLAIDGSSPIPVLEELGGDPHFCGIVVCEVFPDWFFTGAAVPDGSAAESYVSHYKCSTPSDVVEEHLALAVQQTLVLRSPLITLRDLLGGLTRARIPHPPYVSEDSDRTEIADFTTADPGELTRWLVDRQHGMPHAATPDELRTTLRRLDQLALRINSRGGRVIFALFPAGKQMLELEDGHWPRAQYWDALARQKSSTAINCRDYPQFIGLRSSDGSHLDGENAARFTRDFGTLLLSVLEGARP